MWTPEREKLLVSEWEKGHRSASKIADLLGPPFTRNAVVAKIWRLRKAGLPLRSSPNGPGRIQGAVFVRRQRQRAKAKEDLKIKAANPAQPSPPVHTPVHIKEDPGGPRIFCVEDLERNHCRWIYESTGEPGFGFCGLDRLEGLSYCHYHSLRAFAPPFLQSHPELRRHISENSEKAKELETVS